MSDAQETFRSVEMCSMEVPKVRYALKAVQQGLEYAAEALAIHDVNLGRTTLKNKRHAEIIEDDIRHINAVIENLKECLGDRD